MSFAKSLYFDQKHNILSYLPIMMDRIKMVDQNNIFYQNSEGIFYIFSIFFGIQMWLVIRIFCGKTVFNGLPNKNKNLFKPPSWIFRKLFSTNILITNMKQKSWEKMLINLGLMIKNLILACHLD
jgi:hypothetical protein